MSTTTWAWLVLLFPLVGCLAQAFGFRRISGRTAGWIGTIAITLAFLAAVATLISLQGHPSDHRQLVSSLWQYATTVGVDGEMSILVDPLSVFMLLVVTGVSATIHLYSIAYMDADRGEVRFFSYLNFFVFAMLLLVLAGNFLILIVGWAFVGAASYLLISFWYRRTTATRAGLKAFVINVVGDVGLVLGTYFIFKHTGSLDFLKSFAATEAGAFGPGNDETDLVVGCVLLLVGAFAKSAQIPLHTWLPDAMEGPTPVSALIHAATMVTAGVYLIARMHPLFERAPTAQDVGAVIGCATLLMAASIALVQTDIKRVIAYSTMSQIGYMIMGVSVGAYAAGMFHLMTHAFFKALLFMGAGSIISAMAGEQSLDRMGGFRRAMPFTYACFIVGGLALSGVPPFSGFFSKDEILLVTGERGSWHWALYVMGYVGAFLTAVYTFRMIFRAFHGAPVPEARELEEGHLHHAEVPRNPITGEEEDTGVGYPGPTHAIAERAPAMKRGDDRARDRRDGRGSRADPERGLRDRRLPAALVRHLGAVRTAHQRRPACVRARARHRACARRDRARLPDLGGAPGHGGSGARAPPRPVRGALAQVVLRRADRSGRRATDGRCREVRARHVRAPRGGRDDRRRHERDRARGIGGGAGCAERLRALLRRAARAGRGRCRLLLPAAELMNGSKD